MQVGWQHEVKVCPIMMFLVLKLHFVIIATVVTKEMEIAKELWGTFIITYVLP